MNISPHLKIYEAMNASEVDEAIIGLSEEMRSRVEEQVQ
jgi:hypothetical protein